MIFMPTTDVNLSEVETALSVGETAKKTEPISNHNELGTRALGTRELADDQAAVPDNAFWFVVNSSCRRISLPVNGELVLGRFDPNLATPLDVDLTYEDQKYFSVSRQHAKITCSQKDYFIEDLGSSNGSFVNGERLSPHQPHQLQIGDCVMLGKIKMSYNNVPEDTLEIFAQQAQSLQHFLAHPQTGRKMRLAPSVITFLGRFEPGNCNPTDINFADDGDISLHISRQHAKIIWRNHLPFIEDFNSACGTRLNGAALSPGKAVALKPGDHISLGKCVLAYDVEI